jgi:hypothetical protein
MSRSRQQVVKRNTRRGIDLRLTAGAYDRSMEQRTVILRFWIGVDGTLAARAIDPHTREARALEHPSELYRLCFGVRERLAAAASDGAAHIGHDDGSPL